MPDTLMATAQAGRVTYEGRAAAQRIGPDRQRWQMTYRVRLGDQEIVHDTVSYECWAVSAETILSEAAYAGLSGRIEADIVVLHGAAAR